MQRLSQDRARPRIGRALARSAAARGCSLSARACSRVTLRQWYPGGGIWWISRRRLPRWLRRAAPCSQPQPFAIGTDEQPATRADARGLRYRPDGRTARAVATEPIGFWPAGAGDRPGAQRLHPEIAGNTKLDE